MPAGISAITSSRRNMAMFAIEHTADQVAPILTTRQMTYACPGANSNESNTLLKARCAMRTQYNVVKSGAIE
jgi:hypothetical protein